MKPLAFIFILTTFALSMGGKKPFAVSISYTETGDFQLGLGKNNHYLYLQPKTSYRKFNDNNLTNTDHDFNVEFGYKFSFSVIEFKDFRLSLNTSLGYAYSGTSSSQYLTQTQTRYDYVTGIENSDKITRGVSRTTLTHSLNLGFSPEIRYQNLGIFVNPYLLTWSNSEYKQDDMIPYGDSETESQSFSRSRFSTIDSFDYKDLQFGIRFYLPI